MKTVYNTLAKVVFFTGLFASVFAWGQDEFPSAKTEPGTRSANQKITTFTQLCAAYRAQKIKFQKNENNESLLFKTSKGKFAGVMVVKWDTGSGVVHFIQTMPLTLEKEQVPLFLKIAQTLNHGFVFPGIGVNLDNFGTYYRLSIPVAPRGYLFDYEIGTYTKFALNKATEFLPTIQEALEGNIKLEELILFHQKHLRDLRSQIRKDVNLQGMFVRESGGVRWELDFTKPGIVRFSRDGEVERVATYQIAGNQVTFQDQTGSPLAEKKGVYEVFISNQKLTFRNSNDPVESRGGVLAGGTWTEKK